MHDKSFEDIDNTFDNLSEMEWQCKKFKKIFNTARAIKDHLISKDCTDLTCHLYAKNHLNRNNN